MEPDRPSRGGFLRVRIRAAAHRTQLRFDGASSAPIARRAVVSMGGLIATGGGRFLTAVLIGRIGGASVLGTTQSAIALAQLLTLVWPSSAGSAASKHIAAARGRGDLAGAGAVARYLYTRGVAVGAVLGCIGALLWWVLGFGGPDGSFAVAGLTLAFSMYGVAKGMQLGAGLVNRSAVLDGICAAISVGGVVLLLLVGTRGIILVLPTIVGFAVCATSTRARPTVNEIPPRTRREIVVFILLGSVGTLASAGFLQASIVVAKLAGGASLAGQYAAALALTAPISMVATAISLSLFPMLAEAIARGDEYDVRRQTVRATDSLVVVMLGIAGPASLLAGPAILALWGREFEDAAVVVPIVLIAVVCNTVSVPAVNSLTSRSNRGMALSAASSVVGFGVGASIWVVAAGVDPLLGIAIGYAIGVGLISLMPIAIVWYQGRYPVGATWIRCGAGIGAIAVVQAVFIESGRSPIVAVVLSLGYALVWYGTNRASIAGIVRAVR